jgi:radical SAM superfamily enzyme YgiQ (UPF0313 family)
MGTKYNVYFIQPNYRYGDNVFVPYSVGSIQAYAETIPEIREHFQFHQPIFLRENPKSVLLKMEKPNVVGFSCYLWNWEYNKSLARHIRVAHPNALIVFGGTQVPDASDDFFLEHPYVDVLIHQEGEFSFADILLQFLSGKPDYGKISGLSIRVGKNITLKTASSSRIRVLSKLPSPYLSGVFDFFKGMPFILNVSQETNRGCPYMCSFCYWGGNMHAKLFPMSEERILEEFEWFGLNKVEYVFNCDANYGILLRDYALTEKMVRIRAKHGGYPKKFRMCTAKNSNDKIFNIVKLLNDAGMNKGATISFQSMDKKTLKTVKRKNIKQETFVNLMNRYRDIGIPTYTELIIGMPGETYKSSKNGIDILFDGQAESINLYVYVCTVLPNSEMSLPGYIQAHGIKSVRMPVLLAHSTPAESLTEYHNVIVGTSSMPQEDWKRTYLFFWAVQCFHCLGLLRHVAIFFRKYFKLKYSDFYERLIYYFSRHPNTTVGKQIALVREIVNESMKGGRLDLVIPRFGDIYWPLEEATLLSLVIEKEKFYKEIRSFVERVGQEVNTALLEDLVLYQSAMMIDPYSSKQKIELQYDIHGYFTNCYKEEILRYSKPYQLVIEADRNFSGDLKRYAQEVVWYGRKGGKFHHSNVAVEVVV